MKLQHLSVGTFSKFQQLCISCSKYNTILPNGKFFTIDWIVIDTGAVHWTIDVRAICVVLGGARIILEGAEIILGGAEIIWGGAETELSEEKRCLTQGPK